jgi:HPt (histidine-containing phosphotransfer) domain-containing protein
VSASAPITIEEVQVGEVILHLSRRALEEELSAGARREIARVAVLAVIPCILLALFLWRLAALRAARDAQTQADGRRESDPSPLRLPTDWNIPDARRAYLEACRVFLRERRNEAALLCRLAAAEDWKGLHEAAGALREAALTVNARALAAAALSVQEAALADAASAARHVEHCIPPLFEVLDEAERLLRDNADPALKDMT